MQAFKDRFKEQLDSNVSGPHFTAYLAAGGPVAVRRKAKAAVARARVLLSGNLSQEEQSEFFRPVDRFIQSLENVRLDSGGLALFRTKTSFRALRIPIDTENVVVVADSFHIKPLIKWSQIDMEYALLGFDAAGVNLYRGSMYNFRKVDSFLFPLLVKMELAERDRLSLPGRVALRESMVWADRWVTESMQSAGVRIFLAGRPDLVEPFLSATDMRNVTKRVVRGHFDPESAQEIAGEVRAILRKEIKRKLQGVLTEYMSAESAALTTENLHMIARAAASGKVRKLYIAEDFHLWGKLDGRSGRVTVEVSPSSEPQDCVLDDLAETVIRNGGEVFVGKLAELPNHRPISAILEPDTKEVGVALRLPPVLATAV